MTEDPLLILARGKWVDFVSRGSWEFVTRKNICGIVAIAAVTDEGKIVLVEQYRQPMGKVVIELPAGLAGDSAGLEGEPLEQAARRELLEETGYEAREMIRLLEGASSAGITDETVTLFLARHLTRVSDGGGSGGECITVHEVPVKELIPWLLKQIAAGKTLDLKLFSGLCFAIAPDLLTQLTTDARDA